VVASWPPSSAQTGCSEWLIEWPSCQDVVGGGYEAAGPTNVPWPPIPAAPDSMRRAQCIRVGPWKCWSFSSLFPSWQSGAGRGSRDPPPTSNNSAAALRASASVPVSHHRLIVLHRTRTPLFACACVVLRVVVVVVVSSRSFPGSLESITNNRRPLTEDPTPSRLSLPAGDSSAGLTLAAPLHCPQSLSLPQIPPLAGASQCCISSTCPSVSQPTIISPSRLYTRATDCV
jgi:hypothetical protein